MNIPIYAREVIHEREELDKLKWENVRVGNLIEIYNKELNKKRIVSVKWWWMWFKKSYWYGWYELFCGRNRFRKWMGRL